MVRRHTLLQATSAHLPRTHHACLGRGWDGAVSPAAEASSPSSSDPARVASTGDSAGDEEDEEEYEGWWSAHLLHMVEMREDSSKKAFMVYEMEVSFTSKRTGNRKTWYCQRRYSDFDNFNTRVRDLPRLAFAFWGNTGGARGKGLSLAVGAVAGAIFQPCEDAPVLAGKEGAPSSATSTHTRARARVYDVGSNWRHAAAGHGPHEPRFLREAPPGP